MPSIPTMPKNRAIYAIAVGLLVPLVALAQAPGAGQAPGSAPQGGFALPGGIAKEEKKAAPPTEAEKTIDEAITKLKAAKSFSAELLQSVDMLGQKFEIKGTYLKSGNNRIYLKLTVNGLGDASATTLQACDGTTLWDFRQVLDTQTYSKFKVGPIFAKLENPVLDDSWRDRVTTRLGFAGPDVLLAGLRSKVGFNQKAEETLDGKKVWVIRGEWKDRTGLTGPNQQPLPPTVPLPPYMPANVAVWLGQGDGFPYKVEMYGNLPSMLAADTRRLGPDNKPIGAKPQASKVEPSRIILVYTDVKVNPEIKPELFGWQPPADAKGVVDGTDAVLGELDQAIQMETARKKTEAAKAAEPTLPEAIAVPKATDLAPTEAPK
jgi:outer membrane lipoprotein-sorting protein